MRTLGGVTYATFEEACQKLGFLTDDIQWIKELRDRCECSFQRLTELFAFIISHRKPADPNKNNFRSQEYLNRCPPE